MLNFIEEKVFDQDSTQNQMKQIRLNCEHFYLRTTFAKKFGEINDEPEKDIKSFLSNQFV